MSEQTKGVGITLKMDDIIPLSIGQLATQRLALTLGKVGRDGTLTRMSKRRIAQVVSQTSCRHNTTNLPHKRSGQFGVALQQCTAYPITQRTPHTSHLETVSQAIMHKHATRQGEYLCLIL